jgi:predicted TIM-barrel fold metal-dependent hydrolase
MSRRIDVHVHYLPEPYVEALAARGEPPRLVRQDGALLLDFGGGGAFPLEAEMTDLELHRRGMERAGIDQAVLSISPPAVDGLEPAEARAVAAASNDALADLSRGHDGRFLAMATLPAVDPEAAAAELRRAAGLGLRAGVLLTNVRGARLDEERFRAIFESAAELDLPLVLHPTTPAHPDPFVEFGLMTTVGFIMETTVCVLRLVLSGLYERHPGFKLLVPHVGAVIPYLLGRIEYEMERYGVGAGVLSEPVGEQLRRLYLDSVSAWPPAIRLAVDAFGAERVLFGSDAPFWEREKNVNAIDGVGLEPADAERVCAGNAEALFGRAVAVA